MANKINSLFILLTILATASATIGLLKEWSDFKRTYAKNYNIFEDAYRKSIFFSNVNQIKLHNLRFTRGCETYELGVNQFTDLTYAEFAKVFQESSSLQPQGSPYPPKGLCNNIKDNLPPWQIVDWRVFGGDTPVKDQGLTCNNGWAFAALSSLEGRTFAATQVLPQSLSAQNLIDCTVPQACTSKTPTEAFVYIIREQNVNTDIWYPYIGKPGSCRYLSTNLGATCANYATLFGEEHIKDVVMTTGPVAFEFDPLSFSFMHYKSGVFRTPAPLRPSRGRHYMSIIGFGNDAQSGNYWLVKNSFGTSWGENGYIRIASYDKNGGIKSPSFPIVF